jgi:excisionase family DNA binding protein
MHARRSEQTAGAEELLTVDEAARRLSLGRTATYRLVSTGELASRKIGRSRRVLAASVREYARRGS